MLFGSGYFFSTPPALGATFSPDSIDFGDGQILQLTCRVTFVSVALDYILATSTFSHQYASAAPVVASWLDGARLSAIINGGDQSWQLLTLVTPGIPGSASLSSALPAIVTVTPSTNSFVIPTNDPAHVSFRFSTAAESYITYVPAELTLNNATGQLTWNTRTANFVNGALYAVQVQLMHLNSSGQVDNYAPIDFIIALSTSTLNAPVFVAPSPAAGTVISAAQFCGNQTFFINATGATPLTISAVGLPLSTADLVFSGGAPVTGQRWTTASIVFHPVTALMSTVVTFQAVDQQSPPQTTIYSLAFTSTLTDTNPPMTVVVTQPAALSTAVPVSSASFSLAATDDCSGVRVVHWLLDGVLTNVSASTTSFTVNTIGPHTVSYYSTDFAGNNEALHTLQIVIQAGSGLGDPQFRGLLGQSFQVHGIDGAVYNLVSDRRTQINARFVFLTSGKCPNTNNGSTAGCWSHPGSYMGELSFQQVVDGELHYCAILSGSASAGFSSVQVDGITLKQGEGRTFGSHFSIEYLSSHYAVVRVEQYELQLGNSDQFINVEALVPLVPLAQLQSHGLLGQTHASRVYPNALKYVEGEVDDYLIASNNMLASDFVFNQFEAVMETDQ